MMWKPKFKDYKRPRQILFFSQCLIGIPVAFGLPLLVAFIAFMAMVGAKQLLDDFAHMNEQDAWQSRVWELEDRIFDQKIRLLTKGMDEDGTPLMFAGYDDDEEDEDDGSFGPS